MHFLNNHWSSSTKEMSFPITIAYPPFLIAALPLWGWHTGGQWFIVSYDTAYKQEHYKKPLHWANQPQ